MIKTAVRLNTGLPYGYSRCNQVRCSAFLHFVPKKKTPSANDRLDELAAKLDQIAKQMESDRQQGIEMKSFLDDYDAQLKTPQEMIAQSKKLSKKKV